MSTPRALPAWVEDEDGRHLRGSARYEAVVNPDTPEPRLRALVERAESAAQRAETIREEVTARLETVGAKGAPDDVVQAHRPTAAEAAREQ